MYRWNGTSWAEEAKLTASDGMSGDSFGLSVAIHSNTLLVGAPTRDKPGTGATDHGSVYVFTRSDTMWSEQQILTASDADANDRFGMSAAILGGRLVVGASFENENGSFAGASYVFELENGTWVEDQKLLASDGDEGDVFGTSVALSSTTIAVGAHSHNIGSEDDQGAVYLFTHDGSQWNELQKLISPDADPSDQFGFSLSIFNATLLIGAPTDNEGGDDAGAAYVFTRSGGNWGFAQKLIASDSGEEDRFGVDVALHVSYALVGAPFDDDTANATGSSYFFTRSIGVWSETEKLTDDDAALTDQLGESVALYFDNAVVGARADDEAFSDQGSAQIFANVLNPCPTDLNDDGMTDGADLGLLLGNWGNSGGSDLNSDGTTDGADLGLLLGAWGACP
ncbi:MAG: hypothetical protein ACF8GE_01285 [Phycisphaerales bacterium JB043]